MNESVKCTVILKNSYMLIRFVQGSISKWIQYAASQQARIFKNKEIVLYPIIIG